MKQYKIVFSYSVQEEAADIDTAVDNAWQKFVQANPFTYREFDMTIEEVDPQ
jgi:hypothetical protein